MKEMNTNNILKIEDIEKEVMNYKKDFEGKRVLCIGNGSKSSPFWKFFNNNYEALKLKKLHIIGSNEGCGEDQELIKDFDIVVSFLPSPSDCVALIQELIKSQKEFLVAGCRWNIREKEFFQLLKDGKCWLGLNTPSEEREKALPFLMNFWYTNFDNSRRHEKLKLTAKFDPDKYPEFQNYKAVFVDKLENIPCDYFEAIAVPESLLQCFNPEQFELLGTTYYNGENLEEYKKPFRSHREPFLKNSTTVMRMFVRLKKATEVLR